jgi:hypothetical protein
MAGAGIKKFVTGEVFSAVNVNTYLMDQAVAVFNNAAERDAAFDGEGEPVLTEGRLCYLKSTKKVQFYDGNFWIDSAQFTVGDGTITSAKLDETSGSEAVTTVKIRNDAVTADKLADSTSTDGDRAVTTNHIRNNAITTAKLGTNLTFSGTTTIDGMGKIQQLIEKSTKIDSSLTGAQILGIGSGAIFYYSANSTGNFQFVIQASNDAPLNSVMSDNDVTTVVAFTTQGTLAYRLTALTIPSLTEGVTSTVNVFWFGGTSYPPANVNAIDVYTITIVKTANHTFNVFASQSSFKA